MAMKQGSKNNVAYDKKLKLFQLNVEIVNELGEGDKEVGWGILKSSIK